MKIKKLKKHGIEITKTLTLSTCHISEDTAKSLTNDPDDNNLGLCIYEKAEYGWYIYIDDNALNTIKTDDTTPEDLKRAITLADSLGCKILCLDCDGPECDFLPIYNW